MTLEVAQARAQPKDCLRFRFNSGSLQPLEGIIVRAIQAKALDVLVPFCMPGKRDFGVDESPLSRNAKKNNVRVSTILRHTYAGSCRSKPHSLKKSVYCGTLESNCEPPL
jgi:hypothetical protein